MYQPFFPFMPATLANSAPAYDPLNPYVPFNETHGTAEQFPLLPIQQVGTIPQINAPLPASIPVSPCGSADTNPAAPAASSPSLPEEPPATADSLPVRT